MEAIVAFASIALIAGAAQTQEEAQVAPAEQPARKFPTFARSDTDRDGFLTQAEWDASGRSPKRMSRVDTDKDGKVSREELRAATLAARAAREGAQPKP